MSKQNRCLNFDETMEKYEKNADNVVIALALLKRENTGCIAWEMHA
jgi:hypothetical protein